MIPMPATSVPGSTFAEMTSPTPIAPPTAVPHSEPIPGGPLFESIPGDPLHGPMPAEAVTGDIDPNRFAGGDGVTHEFTNLFFAESEYLLWRMQGTHLPPLTTASMMPPALFNSMMTQTVLGDNHQGTGWDSGFRLHAGVWFNCDHVLGVDSSFFFLGQQSAGAAVSSGGMPVLAVPFVTPAGAESSVILAGLGLSGSAAVRLETRMSGYEVNLRTNLFRGPCGHIDVFGGFRALSLADNLSFAAMSSTPLLGTARDEFDTRNWFYGGQIGAEIERRADRWSVDLISKVALGNTNEVANINGMSTPGSILVPGGFFTSPGNFGRHTQDRFSVVPELGVKVGYQVNDYIRLTAGYNVLYWSNVVRPGEQINRMIVGSPMFTFRTSDFWVQGITAGVEIRY
jgi:hypothetical protein